MHNIARLEQLGYNQLFDTKRQDLGADIEQIARVIAEHKGFYEVATNDEEHRAEVTGKRMLTATSRDDYPAVGDWVVIRKDADGTKIIEDILPRMSTLHKRYGGTDNAQLIVANADVAFIVESSDRDYSLNRFERYLVLAREGGVRPVIVLNKSDLLSEADQELKVRELHERFGDIDVIITNTVNATGTQALSDYLQKGVTYCFLGSSGVGKSSIINDLLAGDRIKTQEIGQKTGRGRHTTTAREMYITDAGGIIIDNPGSREVGVVDSGSGVKEVFTDIEEIAENCRFKDCGHTNEPGCAIRDALSASVIDAAHYENYKKLQKETLHHQASTYAKRQKDKKFGKYVKTAKKDLKKYRPS